MKKIILLFLMIVCVLNMTACKNDKTVQETENVEQTVTKDAQEEKKEKKKLENDNYLLIEEKNYDKNGDLSTSYKYTYDKKENQFCEELKLYLSKDIITAYEKSGIKFVSPAISTASFNFDSTGKVDSLTFFGYDVAGKSTSSKQYFFYDEKGYITEQHSVNSSNELTSKHRFSNGRVTEILTYSGQSLSYGCEYTYDDNGNAQQYKFYNMKGNGKETTYYEYEYNDFGLKEKCISSDGGYTEYRYDEYGNMVRSDSYDENGKLTGFTEFIYAKKDKIEYLVPLKNTEVRDEQYNQEDNIIKGVYSYTGQLVVEGQLCKLKLDSPISYQDPLDDEPVTSDEILLSETLTNEYSKYNGSIITLEGQLLNYRGAGILMFEGSPQFIGVSGTSQ